MQAGIDITAADRLKDTRIDDFAIDQFVDLFFEIADFLVLLFSTSNT